MNNSNSRINGAVASYSDTQPVGMHVKSDAQTVKV
jgi:hypothetical protein